MTNVLSLLMRPSLRYYRNFIPVREGFTDDEQNSGLIGGYLFIFDQCHPPSRQNSATSGKIKFRIEELGRLQLFG